MIAKENLGRFNGVFDCAASLVRTEGPFALYKGLQSHLWRNAVWNGEPTPRAPRSAGGGVPACLPPSLSGGETTAVSGEDHRSLQRAHASWPTRDERRR